MQEAPNQDSHALQQRNCWSSPVRVFTPYAFSVLTAVLGITFTLVLTHKSPLIPTSALSAQTGVKPRLVPPTSLKTFQDILSQGNQPQKKEDVLAPGSLYPTNLSLDYTPVPLASHQLHSQKRPWTLNTPSWHVGNFGTQRQAARKHPSEQQSHSTSLPQVSSELALVSEVALKLSHSLQNHLPHGVAKAIPHAQLPQGESATQVIETQPIQNQQEASATQRLELTLSDVVILTLENNRPIKRAYLERIAQRQDLAVAEDKFVPNFTPTVSIAIAQFGSNGITTSNSDISAGTRISVRIPTGGELSFGWTVNNDSTLDSNNDFLGTTDNDSFSQNLQLSFNQPLLRGAGINVNTASIEIARLTEKSNILALKSTLIDTITNAILGYHELLRTQERLKIEQRALELAQEILEVNRVLVEAGRLAPVDIVQSEAAVANRQVSLLAAQNNLASTKLALLDILDLGRDTDVSAESITAKPTSVDSNKLRQLAFENRSDYLRSKLNREIAQRELLLAEDNRRWDLNLITSLNNTIDQTTEVRSGLRLSHEFGDLTREQRFQRARINLLQSENTLEDLNDSIEIQVIDRIRDVNLRLSQVELARQATELAERQLEIEREKQRLGRGSGIFELVRLQDDFAQAKNVELDATINYLNALIRLDQTLGTTLDTWQVTIEEE
jgi:outer membrane protein TolC